MKNIFKKVCSLLLVVMLLISSMCLEAFAAETPDGVMEVTVGGTTTSYTDFGKGWVAALKASTSAPATIKLLADWVPNSTIDDGDDIVPAFYYEDEDEDGDKFEFGTEDGQLHLDDEDIRLTIDLNGFDIDRGLDVDPTYYGRVFYIENGELTIKDTSEAAKAGNPGKITGAWNIQHDWHPEACQGGAIFIENESVLRIEGGEISGNKTIMTAGAFWFAHGGAIYAINNATIYMSGGVIKGNTAQYYGGAIYLYEHANFYMDGGLITGNESGQEGGGIYCETDGILCFAGGEISENHAKVEGDEIDRSGDGGGVYIITSQGTPDIFFGGDIKILENIAREGADTRSDNFAIHNNSDGFELKHAVAEQKEADDDFSNVPNKPLTDGAEIWFNFIPWNLDEDEDVNVYLSDEKGLFYEDSYKYFHSDFSEQIVCGVYNTEDPYHPYHEIRYVSKATPEGKLPAIESVYKLSGGPLVSADVDKTNNKIELIARANMKNYFAEVSLDQLIGAIFNASDVSIVDGSKLVNMLNGPLNYKVINSKDTYVQYTLTVSPEGGEWSDDQQAVTPIGNHKLIVRNDKTGEARGYTSFDDGWSAAYNMAKDENLGNPSVTVTLRGKWEAKDGKFAYTNGTNNGRLYVDDGRKITIDLNGYTIDRNIGEDAVGSGQVFRIASGGSLTIEDNSASQTGTITGGNNTGNGGAFYIDYGTLYIEGGSISGNKAAEGGGGIYVQNKNMSYVYIRGGSITGNTAGEYGGGIHCYDGYLFLEGGTISDNIAQYGGGIYWESDDPTVWTGTTVTDNTASMTGGGIYAENNDEIYVGGSIRITGNTMGIRANNLYISESDTIIYKTDGQKISGEADIIPELLFTKDAMIGLSVYDSSNNYTFTTDNSHFDGTDYRYFSADSSAYVIRSEPNNDSDDTYKLHITKKSNSSYGKYGVSFIAGAGTGVASDSELPANSRYTLPECDFTAPAGTHFVGWKDSADGRIYQAGEIFTATEGHIYTAIWRFDTPVGVSFTATDDSSGGLSGVGSGMEYIVVGLSSSSGWKSISGDSATLDRMLNGNSVIYVRYKSDDGILESDAVIIEVDQAEYTGTEVKDACCDKNNGSLTYLIPNMEYRLKTDNSGWQAITEDRVDNLAPGEYELRVKASGTVLASRPYSVTLKQLGHSFTNYVSDDNATCAADGTKTAACDYGCGATDTKTDEGSRKPHSFKTEWSVNETYHWHEAICEHTEEKSDYAKHSYTDGVCVCGKTAPEKTAAPVITYDEETFRVSAAGEGTVLLYVNGTAVSNPYTFEQDDVEKTYVVTATAQADGKELSDVATKTVTVPAKTVTPAPEKTAAPVITYDEETFEVSAAGEGTVLLYVDGTAVSNPYTFEQGDAEKTYVVTATAQADGKELSDVATKTVTVPAKTVTPAPAKTAAPVITYNEETFRVSAAGEGTVLLYVDGTAVSNPYTFTQGDEDATYVVTATAQADGKELSDAATMTVTVPEKTDEPPVPSTNHSITVEGGTANVTEAKVGDTVTVTADAAPAGKQFKEWTSEDGVEFANANEATTTFVMPDKNVTVTANYEAVSVVETFTVIYTDGVNRAEIFEDLIFEDLLYGEATPAFDGVPVRDGYHFDGWSPAVEAIVTGDATYTATWTRIGSGDNGGGSYTPTAPKVTVTDGENGDVTVSSGSAGKGSTVTIVVTPDEGYILGDLIVTDEEGNVIEVTDKGNGKYTFEMPASKVSVEVTFVKDDLSRFVDVPADAYYYDAVLWAVKQGITNGTDETHFSPDLSCTRAQSVTFLWRAAGCPEPVSKEMPFTDVQEDSYYYDAVLWAVENGITNGTSATTFGPDAKCTRAQIVTFLMRALKSQADGTDNPFSDVDSASYYTDAVLWAVEQGITNGTSEATFSPNADCTRAQIVTFLYRALGGK